MTSIESKVGSVAMSEEQLFGFLSDFRNFTELIPVDKVSNWNATETECSFSVAGAGDIKLRLDEKEAFKLIKIVPDASPLDFNFYVQLKQINENDTKVKLTIRAKMNSVMSMMIKKPMKEGIDKMVEQMAQIPNLDRFKQ